MSKKPLEGIRVLDFTNALAGPYCSMMLGNMGAEVIKVEKPGTGDDARGYGPFVNGQSGYFVSVNHGKKSVVCNTKDPEGVEMFKDLVKHVDIVVENLKAGAMNRMGLGYEELKKVNPKLIYVAISGFGQTGPYAPRPAYDMVVQAMGGVMSITGEPGGKPVRVDTVVLSTQHAPEATLEQIRKDMIELVIKPTVPAELMDENTKIYVNPTGRFVIGGPQGDSGLTGRKIIVDTYGGSAPHGGGCFSGKDPTKVDRSAAYAARWIAKNIVAAGLASKCQVQLAYAIGVAHPVSVLVETFGTGTVADTKLEEAVEKVFDLTPAAIIRDLDLRKPIYRKLAAYGHMGREDLGVKWENTDRVEELKAAVAAL